jgi:hypothetical protein
MAEKMCLDSDYKGWSIVGVKMSHFKAKYLGTTIVLVDLRDSDEDEVMGTKVYYFESMYEGDDELSN